MASQLRRHNHRNIFHLCDILLRRLIHASTLSLSLPKNLTLFPALLMLIYHDSHHTLLDHSSFVRHKTTLLDYLGILLPLLTTTLIATFYTFRLHPTHLLSYLSFTTLSGTSALIVLFDARFSGPRARSVRVVTFGLLGLASAIPVIHGVYLFGVKAMDDKMALRWYLALGFWHAIGAGIYGARVPERVYPRYVAYTDKLWLRLSWRLGCDS